MYTIRFNKSAGLAALQPQLPNMSSRNTNLKKVYYIGYKPSRVITYILHVTVYRVVLIRISSISSRYEGYIWRLPDLNFHAPFTDTIYIRSARLNQIAQLVDISFPIATDGRMRAAQPRVQEYNQSIKCIYRKSQHIHRANTYLTSEAAFETKFIWVHHHHTCSGYRDCGLRRIPKAGAKSKKKKNNRAERRTLAVSQSYAAYATVAIIYLCTLPNL